jgi:HPt (histidine-containing phosphotransfer) domain-containing protein
MRVAVAEGDGGALSRQAHALRGSSTMVGAAAVAELCELLEQPHDAVASAVLVERAGEAYARTVEPLRAALR